MTEDDRRRLLIGVSASVAVHLVGVLLVVLLPATSVTRLAGSDITASSSPSRARGFPGDTSSRVTSRPRRPAPPGSDANASSDTPGHAGEPGARGAGARRTAQGESPQFQQSVPDISGSVSIVGSVVDGDGVPVAGVTIAYLTASARRGDAQARYGDQSRAATVDQMPPSRRRTLIDWLTRIDPQETYTGGIVRGTTNSTGMFTITVSEPDVYIVTAQRPSPPQIGSIQPVIVDAGQRIMLPQPIRLVEGWSSPAPRQHVRVRARDLADDDPRVRSWGRQRQYFRESKLIVLSWQEAQEVLLTSDLRGGKNYLTGWLTILTTSDDHYLTKPPDPLAFSRFARQYSLSLDRFATE